MYISKGAGQYYIVVCQNINNVVSAFLYWFYVFLVVYRILLTKHVGFNVEL